MAASESCMGMRDRFTALGRALGEREREQRVALEAAWAKAESVHAFVAAGVEAFHAGLRDAGAEQLGVELSAPRVDDKHVRSVQVDLRRGRHRALVTVKSRGDVTLVGPFREGKVEGPCKSFPFDAEAELEAALGDFLAGFLEEAATP